MNTLSDKFRMSKSKLSRVVVFVIFASVSQSSFAQAETDTQATPIERNLLRQEIDAQLIKLLEDKRNEDAFSLDLADSYSQYASLLSEAGSFQEANDAFQQALQIQRSNHGIDGAEQLPILEALFDNHFVLNDIDQAESHVARVVRIEKENPEIEDRPSVTMQLKLGHYFLDKLQTSSPDQEISATYLRSANYYFMAVIEQNKHLRLDQVQLPYGEVAMTNYLGNKIIRKPEFVYERDRSIPLTGDILLNQVRGRTLSVPASIKVEAPIVDISYNEYLNGSFSRATNALKEHFIKAYGENNIEEALYASAALGDFNFLLGRSQSADEYYAVAWKVAGLLPVTHPLKLALNHPVGLPDFNYAYEIGSKQPREASDTSVISVPLKFNVNDKGRLRSISSVVDIDKKLLSKAKRELRRITFRPALAGGVRASIDNFVYAVAVEVD